MSFCFLFNPIPTDNGLNQPIYSYRLTQASRNRVKGKFVLTYYSISKVVQSSVFKKENVQFPDSRDSPDFDIFPVRTGRDFRWSPIFHLMTYERS